MTALPVPADRAHWDFEAIGAPWRIETPSPLGQDDRQALTAVAERFDAAWSRFRSDSLVAAIAAGGEAEFPEEAVELGRIYRGLARSTDGRVSPLVGDALAALGYGPGYRLRPSGAAVRVPAWPGTLDWTGRMLRLAAPATIDVGAAGKGMLVDLLSTELARRGRPDHVVDGSGDLVRRGRWPGPERIALEHPDDPELAVGLIELDEGALASSASNRRAWAGLHHVIDAVDGRPVRDVVASWAVADSAAVADGVATALFFVPGGALAGLAPRAWARLFADGRLERSVDFPGEVFTA